MHFWPAVPENIKNQIRQTIIFLNEGMPPREAVAAARDYVAQRQRVAEADAAREAAQYPQRPSPRPRRSRLRAPTRQRVTGPRIRGM